jgi:hypothetical protein
MNEDVLKARLHEIRLETRRLRVAQVVLNSALVAIVVGGLYFHSFAFNDFNSCVTVVFWSFFAFCLVNGILNFTAEQISPTKRCPKCSGKVKKDWRRVYDENLTFTRTTKHFDSEGNETGYSEEEYGAPGYYTSSSGTYTCDRCHASYSDYTIEEEFVDKEMVAWMRCFLLFPLIGGVAGFVVLGFVSCMGSPEAGLPWVVLGELSKFYTFVKFLIGVGIGLAFGGVLFLKRSK